MAPPLPRAPAATSRKPLVLEEEEWAEALEAIIERDFFPDIPKLQSKLEWLQVCEPRSQVCHGLHALCNMLVSLWQRLSEQTYLWHHQLPSPTSSVHGEHGDSCRYSV